MAIQTPWHISRVALDTTGERVDLWVAHADTRWPCPDCHRALPCLNHADERVWRPLDRCQYQTLVRAPVPTGGLSDARRTAGPRALGRSAQSFTLLTERLIIDLIQQCSTVMGACRIARVT